MTTPAPAPRWFYPAFFAGLQDRDTELEPVPMPNIYQKEEVSLQNTFPFTMPIPAPASVLVQEGLAL